MQNMLTPLAKMYFKNYMMSNFGIDIEKNQNINLLSRININTAFIISDKDEIVAYERYQKMLSTFSGKCFIKTKPAVFNTCSSHGAIRGHNLIESVFRSLI